ncbi:unnamed protein product [Meloidogyne enterolobii]|uniref:Uncharacterized protein n=1 Tax=Meloidogyne enterolobii TaxID=390850 RepID=A0ACB1AEP9_MELEN
MSNTYQHGYGYAQFFGPEPQLVYCPTCKQNKKTKLEFVTDTYAYCFIIAIAGLVICSLSPLSLYCEDCKNVEHYCSVCDTYIGKHVRDGRRPIVILPPELYKNLPNRQ